MLDLCISILVAALAGMGVGGGGLLVIWLVLVMAFPAQTAQGINLIFFIISALAAIPLHLKQRRIPWRHTAWLTISALPGVLLGCHLADKLPETLARRCFGWFLLLSGGMMLVKWFHKKHAVS